MAIIQVAYDVPNDVAVGLASGELMRFGSVIRNRTGIIKHLKEVSVSKAESSTVVKVASASVSTARSKSLFTNVKDIAKKHPVAAVVVGIGAGVAIVGGIVYGRYRSKKKHIKGKIEMPAYGHSFNDVFCNYLDEIRTGALQKETLDTLMKELNQMKACIDNGELEISFSNEQLDTMIDIVFYYTRKLARANSYKIIEFKKPSIENTDGAISGLCHCLEIQKEIFVAAS